jgi:hypothetical protein
MEGDKYIMDAGGAHDITNGAEFAVYQDDDLSPTTLVVVNASNFAVVMDIRSGDRRFIPATSAFAIKVKAGTEENLRFHIGTDNTLTSVFDTLGQKMQHDCIISYVDSKVEAELDIALEDGQVVFNILDPRVINFGLTRIPFRISPKADDVYPVIRAAAHYLWHLRTNKNPAFQNRVHDQRDPALWARPQY